MFSSPVYLTVQEMWSKLLDSCDTQPLLTFIEAVILGVVSLFPPPEPPTEGQPKEIRELRQALWTTVNFRGFDDVKMTLEEALEFFERRYKLKVMIDEDAFKADGVEWVLKVQIAITPIPEMKAPLHRVLQTVIDRIPNKSDAVMYIGPDGIHITTSRALSMQKLRPEPPPPLTTKDAIRARFGLYRTCLLEGWDDPKLTLAEAVESIGRRSHLPIIWNYRAFTREGHEDIWRTEIAKDKPIHPRQAPVGRILQVLIERVPPDVGMTIRMREGGVIEITTKKAVAREK
jgi:hypothetical protein